jgi:hypothetical protein
MPRAREPDPCVEAHAIPASWLRGAGPLGPGREGLEAAVYETVFRYQLRQPLADVPQLLHLYLALRGRDPEAALLRRLQRLRPEVYPFSHCRVTARDGVIDRTTAARGAILQVARLVWVHAAAVDAVGGYYRTHRQAAGFRYHIVRDGGQWAVTAAHLLWRV